MAHRVSLPRVWVLRDASTLVTQSKILYISHVQLDSNLLEISLQVLTDPPKVRNRSSGIDSLNTKGITGHRQQTKIDIIMQL